MAAYSVEKRISTNVFRFYTFVIPSLAAVGISYYRNYGGDGLTSTVGVGIGTVLYGSVAHQWQMVKSRYLKQGAGVTSGVAYSGVYPVLQYEYRFGH